MKVTANTGTPAREAALSWALPALLLAGVLIRLAYIHAEGFRTDIASFESWALALVAHGPGRFYGSTSFLDYPPGYFYILGIVGWIWSGFFSAHDPGYRVLGALVKVPAILFDLGIGALLYVLVRRFASPWWAFGAAALFVLNPAVIFISALWGQVDSVAAFFALLAVYALLRSDDFEETARAMLWIGAGWLALAYCLLVKPQAAVLLPLMIAFAFTDRRRMALRVRATAYGIVAAIVVTVLLVEPFHPSNPIAAIAWLLERLSFGTNVYPYNTVNAFNLWTLSIHGARFWQPDSARTLFVTQATWGIVLLAVALALIVWRYVQAKTPRALLEGSALALLAFFTLATRMHERYMYDGVLFVIACLPLARRYLWCAIGLSAVFWANLIYSWQYIALMTGSPQAGVDAANLWGPWTFALALINVVAFFYLGYVYLGTGEETERAATAAQKPRSRNWFDPREGLATLRKPLDYVVMGVLGVASFLISFAIPKWYWKPTDKIFDEVYFARAAEEYLKNLRIYENTHPPLTKLLITLSTWMFGGLHGGDNSHGWRFLDVLFGALVVMLLYAFGKRVTGSTVWAAVAAGFLMLDGMHYVQSRIATPEGFVVFFALAAVYAFYRFWIASQSEQRPHVVVPPALHAAGALAAIVAGALAMLLFDLAQHVVFGWPWFTLWMSVSGSRTQGPGALLVSTFYFACGFYLLIRNVAFPRLFGDGSREMTFAEGSYALDGASGGEMHTVDGGIIGKGKPRRGELTRARGSNLVLAQEELQITYRRDGVEYATRVGTASYANARTTSGDAVEDGRSAKLWLLLFTLALGVLVSSKWYGVMGFGVSFVILIGVFLQRCFFAKRPALWGNPRGFWLDGALVTIVFVALTVYGSVWIPDLVRQAPDPNEVHNVNDVVMRQYNMYDYHAHLTATHPYASKWFEWPFDYVPVAYYYEDQRSQDRTERDPNKQCCIYEITSMPNPLNLWFGLFCVPFVGVLAWRERNKAYALLVVTYLLQWLPWMKSPRLAWEYHFYVDIPLICLCNAIVLQRIWSWANAAQALPFPKLRSVADMPHLWAWVIDRRIFGYASVVGIVGLIAAAFVFFFPVLSAWPLSYNAWHVRMWMPTWIIGPG
ncbi:MAG TPA: phospholipid carrier-dependent glycosyltransferase [Candidatus Tyrphobacter sp.]